MSEQLICSISLEEIKVPYELCCGHIFEKKEIEKWIEKSATCPLCKCYLFDDYHKLRKSGMYSFYDELGEDKKRFVINALTGNLTKWSLRSINSYITNNKSIENDYIVNLRNNGRKNFDIFKRGNDKFEFTIGDTKVITTNAQLRFFKWLIENNLHKLFCD